MPPDLRLPPMKKREIIERIMTMHWDMRACECWICEAGRAAGCRPQEAYLLHRDILSLPWVERPGRRAVFPPLTPAKQRRPDPEPDDFEVTMPGPMRDSYGRPLPPLVDS